MRSALTLALALVASTGAAPVSFRFEPPIAAESVHVAGDFNAWAADSHPLAESGGVWAGTHELPPGRQRYKFVVNGAVWLPDPTSPEKEEDGFGGTNSIVVVGGAQRPRRTGDWRIDPAALRHDPAAPLHRRRDGEPGALVAFVAAAGDTTHAWVRVPGGPRRALQALPLPHGRVLYAGRLPPGAEGYTFGVADEGQEDGLGAGGWVPSPEAAAPFRLGDPPRLEVPAWVGEAVFYQVFPDRFANGDPGNDPPGSVPWGSAPTFDNFMGGDLAGLRAHLGELAELGVSGLYLNPVFAGQSNHRYDTVDYLRVDPALGDEAELRRLVEDAHDRGIRVILDGVFNHTGDQHPFFQDLKRRGQASPYASWYQVEDWPPRVGPDGKPTYKGWWGFAHLPELVTREPAVRAHVREVVRHWARRAGIDGWRLDVPNEVSHAFWKQFRRWVRAEDPDAYLVGEIWQDGHAWMGGDEFDGVMNYRLRDLMLGFWARRDLGGPEVLARVRELESSHPPEAYRCMLNLMGSHDTPRLRTLAGGSLAAVEGAYGFLFASPGAPCIYYGDELGMEGAKDPDCRRTYPWGDPPAPGLRARFGRLARLRRAHPELRRAPLEPLEAPEDWLLYRRGGLLLAQHRGPAGGLKDPGREGSEALGELVHPALRGAEVVDLPRGARLEAGRGALRGLPAGTLALLRGDRPGPRRSGSRSR